MKRHFLKALQDTLRIWVTLAIGITATSILYAILNVAGLSENASLLIAFTILVGLILLGLFLAPKSLFSLREGTRVQFNKTRATATVLLPVAQSQVSSGPLPWWIQVCRWLWRGLGFVWGTLLVGIAIAIIASLNTATIDTPLAKLNIIHLVQTYPLPVWSSLGLLTMLTLLSWLGSHDKQAIPASPLAEQSRTRMLLRLRRTYTDILAQSLQDVTGIELGLAQRPDAVQNTATLLLRVPHRVAQLLPPGTPIIQVYEEAAHELLILGEPGAGKSTLLTELAQALVKQAEQDVTQPLPILLPLSSWATKRGPLQNWLVEQIALLYDIPRELSRQWVAAEQVLPLLDGLDEMEEAARPACIAAINIYHREHLRPIVVCSRTSEYDVATRHELLALHTAVVVQPLEPEQVITYLASLGKPLAGLRAALETNPVLQELATSPLLLQVLMLTYRGTSVQTLSLQEAPMREQIWTDYVRRMVRDKGDVKRYPLAVTASWLRWLASEMRQHNQAIFSLETLQPDWLPVNRRKRYRWSLGLAGALLYGLFIGLAGALLLGLLGGLPYGLFIGLAGALLLGLLGGLSRKLVAAVKHYLLRFWLARSGIFPWRAVLFLEDATARILLRRIGGEYSFAHRLLLDYFADLDAQTSLTRETAQTTSPSVQTKTSTSVDES